jgi:hypothetical protein
MKYFFSLIVAVWFLYGLAAYQHQHILYVSSVVKSQLCATSISLRLDQLHILKVHIHNVNNTVQINHKMIEGCHPICHKKHNRKQ